jgi:hypothetical protein
MTTLIELAERCEQASGPDRRLDAEIACATRHPHLRPAEPDDFGGKYGYEPGNLKVDTGFLMAYHYTRSMDDAMTLAGAGYHLAFDVHFMPDEDVIKYRGYCFRPDWGKWNPHDMEWLNRDGSDHPLCATPALALSAAALRARAAQGNAS